MTHVDSTAMTDIAYDPATATLRIRFADGDWYRYSGVPAALHAAMIAADSHGRFFHDHIRDRFLYAKED
jgi:hypothetical protein